jgi:hypothetical protein
MRVQHQGCCCHAGAAVRSDSHVKGLYYTLRCFMMDLWDHAQGECAASSDAALQTQLELASLQVCVYVWHVAGAATAAAGAILQWPLAAATAAAEANLWSAMIELPNTTDKPTAEQCETLIVYPTCRATPTTRHPAACT